MNYINNTWNIDYQLNVNDLNLASDLDLLSTSIYFNGYQLLISNINTNEVYLYNEQDQATWILSYTFQLPDNLCANDIIFGNYIYFYENLVFISGICNTSCNNNGIYIYQYINNQWNYNEKISIAYNPNINIYQYYYIKYSSLGHLIISYPSYRQYNNGYTILTYKIIKSCGCIYKPTYAKQIITRTKYPSNLDFYGDHVSVSGNFAVFGYPYDYKSTCI